MILLAHPTANQNVRQAAEALVDAELLAEFWTCVNWRPGSIGDRLAALSGEVGAALRRRSFSRNVQPFIRTSPWLELIRHVSARARLPLVTVDAVYRAFDQRVAKRVSASAGLKAVYCYDDGALETFRVAKSRGLKCIYEHPIAYWRTVRQLQQEEADLHPEWRSTLLGLGNTPEKLARKDEELGLADAVIVPSTFARRSLDAAPRVAETVSVIAYGAPRVVPKIPGAGGSKLNVLFVGALTQAKGIGYLLEAIAKTQAAVELTLVGQRVSAVMPTDSMLARHKWIPSLPHPELLAEMLRHDALVFPSLHDGFGLVVLEAMAQGLAVITTANTCGPDVIEDGVDGFIVPIRSADAIAEKLELLAGDAGRLASTKEAARQTAERREWTIYRQQIVALAREVVASSPTPR